MKPHVLPYLGHSGEEVIAQQDLSPDNEAPRSKLRPTQLQQLNALALECIFRVMALPGCESWASRVRYPRKLLAARPSKRTLARRMLVCGWIVPQHPAPPVPADPGSLVGNSGCQHLGASSILLPSGSHPHSSRSLTFLPPKADQTKLMGYAQGRGSERLSDSIKGTKPRFKFRQTLETSPDLSPVESHFVGFTVNFWKGRAPRAPLGSPPATGRWLITRESQVL